MLIPFNKVKGSENWQYLYSIELNGIINYRRFERYKQIINHLVSSQTREADVLGKAWVGEGYTVSSNGKILISKDGLRQYRPPSYKPNQGKSQANFEQRFPNQTSNKWQSNGHLDIKE